ncbi:hypothetical protein D3C78_1698940 [compost metagenome]
MPNFLDGERAIIAGLIGERTALWFFHAEHAGGENQTGETDHDERDLPGLEVGEEWNPVRQITGEGNDQASGNQSQAGTQ